MKQISDELRRFALNDAWHDRARRDLLELAARMGDEARLEVEEVFLRAFVREGVRDG